MLDRHLLGVIILVAYASLTCFVGLRTSPKLGDHEAINALAARDALENGRWLMPEVGDEPGIRKTPLGIWAIAGVSKIAGVWQSGQVSELTARLPSAIAALITTLAIYWLGSMLYGHRTGLVAGFIAGSCAGTVYFARNAQVDQLLIMFTTLSFAFFWRGALHGSPSRAHMAAFYACFALAMMAKAPLPLVSVGLSLLTYWFLVLPLVEATERTPLPMARSRRWADALARRFRELGNLWIFPGLLVFLVLAGAWPLYVYFKVDHALELWRLEYLGRYTGALSERASPFWYYVPIMFALTFPFLASLPEALAATVLPRYAPHRRALAYAFTWAAVTTVFLSTASFKRPHYLASALPAYCLLLAPVIDRLFFGSLLASEKAVRMTCAVLPLIVGAVWAGAAWYGQKHFPSIASLLALGIGCAGLAWTLSCLAFYAHYRRSAFALLVLGVPLVLMIVTPHLRGRVSLNPEADALEKELVSRGFDQNSDIYWTDGRPNSAVEFYTGIRVRRLMDASKAASVRQDRKDVSSGMKESIGLRIKERMLDPRPAYFIMSNDNYQTLAASGEIPHRVAFEIRDAHPDPDDALVVFTQPATRPEAQLAAPASPTESDEN